MDDLFESLNKRIYGVWFYILFELLVIYKNLKLKSKY